eukprot:TRINITY_DN82514_c0_g1_i1.p1 TRINITY_DN82514_c0_g1~~TRINITY_DN82514_c0_g1_i1.p1  ORF type:complete len:398 (-),score=78.61 TRINITY_DN82514_c0_g1_i1:68-1261(-)
MLLKRSPHCGNLKRDRDEPYPAKCPFCCADLNSVGQVVQHLGGLKHIRSVGGLCTCKRACGAQSLVDCPTQAATHKAAGFDLDALGCMPKVQRRADGSREGVFDQPADPDWMDEQMRWWGEWNFETKGVQSTSAQQIADSFRRLRVGIKAPPFIAPTPLPKNLPVVNPKNCQMPNKWPYEPPKKALFLAFTKMVGVEVQQFDLVCGPQFLYALGGDPNYTTGLFAVEKNMKCLIVENKPQLPVDDLSQPKPRARSLAVKLPANRSFYTFGKFQCGRFRVLVISPVDAMSSDGKVCEIKTGPTPRMPQEDKLKVGMDMVCKGTTQFKWCQIQKDRISQAEKVTMLFDERLPESEFKNSDEYLLAGQRIRHYIAVMLDTVKDKAQRLTFDEELKPVFQG